jgi:predicted transglutaminase-like protease
LMSNKVIRNNNEYSHLSFFRRKMSKGTFLFFFFFFIMIYYFSIFYLSSYQTKTKKIRHHLCINLLLLQISITLLYIFSLSNRQVSWLIHIRVSAHTYTGVQG